MAEKTKGKERSGRDIPYSTTLGGRVVEMLLTVPKGGAPSGVIIPIVSGLASGPRLHESVADKLTDRGHIVARIWQEGAMEHGVRAARYVFTSLVQGSFNGQTLELPERRSIVPVGHSLGARKEVEALLELYEAGDMEIEGAILQAAACLGGVNRYTAPLDAILSVAEEVHHINVGGAIEHRVVAQQGIQSIRALGGHVVREVHGAMRGTIKPQIRTLQQAGMSFVAVDHPDDRLVNPKQNQKAYRELDIPYVEVEAPFTGHDVSLYYPEQTAHAIDIAQATARQPLRRVA